MKISSVIMVIGGLYFLQKWAAGRKADILKTEVMPMDQYSSVTNIWEMLNGQNMTPGGSGPNAHKPYVESTVNECCLGQVGVM